MREKRNIEVLAPAGSFESMKAAVNAGADAVYMGGAKFGARAYAKNPNQEKLLEAVDYVHLHGKKIYLTVNTLLKERELSGELYDFLVPVYEAGVDALIVQDFGVWQEVHRLFPDLKLHASTQMTITGVRGAKELKRQGASRIVTARELSLEEIRKIREQVEIEIETFVHGALCYSYSGQCLFSSLAGGRSGNRGRCAQICRLPYEAWEGEKPISNVEEPYLMNLKDLCGLQSLGELLDAGVCSLKIEGRMKNARYTAGVVSIYRKYVDLYRKVGGKGWKIKSGDLDFLLELFDRGGFSDGYFHEHNGRHMFSLSGKPVRRPVDKALFERLDKQYVEPERKEKIKGNLKITQDLPAKLFFSAGETTVSVEGGIVLPAKNSPLTAESLKKQIGKLGETPFVLGDLDIELSEHCFLPVGELNELRRKGAFALQEEILKPYRRQSGEVKGGYSRGKEAVSLKAQEKASMPRLSVLVEEESQFAGAVAEQAVGRIYLSTEIMEPALLSKLAKKCKDVGKECFFALPRIWREGRCLSMAEYSGADGFLLRTVDELPLMEELGEGYEFVADASLYVFNKEAREMLFKRGITMDTAPFELNEKELRDRGLSGSEMVVYGRLPMMVSAQCIRKTVGMCQKGRKQERLVLSDRKKMRFPVKSYCRFCYNVIYNSAPLWLAQELSAVCAMNPQMVRLQFTTEGKEEVSLVARAYAAALKGENPGRQPENRTRGHFRRGVE